MALDQTRPDEGNDLWAEVERAHIRRLQGGLPRNAFEEMIRLTEEGKVWTFPVDNEAGWSRKGENNEICTCHVFTFYSSLCFYMHKTYLLLPFSTALYNDYDYYNCNYNYHYHTYFCSFIIKSDIDILWTFFDNLFINISMLQKFDMLLGENCENF